MARVAFIEQTGGPEVIQWHDVTLPPPGKERLEGADAMHAWVRIWCGEATGYIELDPTNDIAAGSDHIVVGYGRDYSDIAPVIGVLKSYGNQQVTQAVDVVPVKS